MTQKSQVKVKKTFQNHSESFEYVIKVLHKKQLIDYIETNMF